MIVAVTSVVMIVVMVSAAILVLAMIAGVAGVASSVAMTVAEASAVTDVRAAVLSVTVAGLVRMSGATMSPTRTIRRLTSTCLLTAMSRRFLLA